MSEASLKFLDIIRDYLLKKESSLSIDAGVVSIARSQNVEGIIYKQTKVKDLRAQYYNTLALYYQRTEVANYIGELFTKNQVDYFYVKGQGISSLYPEPYLRTMGDIDIVIHEKDMTIAMEVLRDAGFIPDEYNEISNTEKIFTKDGILVEVHHALLYGSKDTDETVNDDILNYFDNCWEYISNHNLDVSYHFLYVLVHLRKHLMNKGIGIRPFIDLAILSNRKLDWDYLIDSLKELQLLEFAQIVSGLIFRWWGIRSPLTIAITNDFYLDATDEILNAGVYGKENTEVKRRATNQLISGSNRIKVALELVFPSYKMMTKSDKYCGLIGKPMLLPIYWVYRWFSRGGIGNISLFVNTFARKNIQDQKEKYRKWGLL